MIARQVLRTWLGAAAYGYSLGAAHDQLYAVRNLLKFPLLITATALLCAVSYWIAAWGLGVRLTLRAVQGAAWSLFADVAVLLASAAPIVLFLACVMRATDDGRLGEYDFLLLVNVVLVALSGALALMRRSARLVVVTESRARRIGVVSLWLALSLFTGGQVAFLLRPMVGLPATRGGTPPWFLGNEPDVRGATNFYAAVWQALRGREMRGERR